MPTKRQVIERALHNVGVMDHPDQKGNTEDRSVHHSVVKYFLPFQIHALLNLVSIDTSTDRPIRCL